MKKIKITSCFCDIPVEKLVRLVRKRYVEGIATGKLMRQLRSKKEREYLATIALLDVKKNDLVKIASSEDPSIYTHLVSCYLAAKETLKKEGVKV